MATSELKIGNMDWLLKDGPYIMGVVNLTPDSFSDGGAYINQVDFENRITEIKGVVDIVDLGGESTRPGALAVSVEEECERVIPKIEWLRQHHPDIIISIDTYKVETARKAIKAGAHIINDISAGDSSNQQMLELAKETDVPIVLMHKKGTPENMQKNVHYNDLIEEIYQYFEKKIDILNQLNLSHNKIILDLGIGFGKFLEHNLELIKNIPRFKKLGFPMMIGASKKRMVGELTDHLTANRLYGSIGVHLAALMNGVDIIRVHDPVEMRAAMNGFFACQTDLKI